LRQVAQCLACAGEGHKAAKKRLKAGEAAGVAKVIGTSKLRTKYESHEAKRALCGAYDLFLADERILPSLPKLLGAPPPRRRSLASVWCRTWALMLLHVSSASCPTALAPECAAAPPPQPGNSLALRTCLAPWCSSVWGGDCWSSPRAPKRLYSDACHGLAACSAEGPVWHNREGSSKRAGAFACMQARRSSGRSGSRCPWTCAAATGARRSSAHWAPRTSSTPAAPASTSGAAPATSTACERMQQRDALARLDAR